MPTKYWKTQRAVGFWTGGPFWLGKVASWSLSAFRMRYSKAAYTSKQTVMTISNAMIRSVS